jgi:septum formation protein
MAHRDRARLGFGEAIDSRDPTALIGLPLIGLAQMLREAGYTLP